MKPKSFSYLRPDDLQDALQALQRLRDDARVMAGGLSLVPMMNFRLLETKYLIDISGLESLAYIREASSEIEIGAAETQANVLAWPKLAKSLPLLSLAMPHIGHFQTRSRGTVCGSIAHSDPSSELPLCLATLGGSVVLQSARATRVLAADEFQVGMLYDFPFVNRVPATRLPRWRNATAILPSAPLQRWSRKMRYDLASAAWRKSRRCAIGRRLPTVRSTTRSTNLPGSSAAATTFTQMPPIAVILCASLAAALSRRRRNARIEGRRATSDHVHT